MKYLLPTVLLSLFLAVLGCGIWKCHAATSDNNSVRNANSASQSDDNANENPSQSGPIIFNEYRPWLTKYRGPKKAKGIVYFMHGWFTPGKVEDDFHAGPYLLHSLSAQGWDVIVSQALRDRPLKKFDPRISDYLAEKAAAFRSQGYRRVVMAGLTWGAWSILKAERSGRLGADVLLLFSPAAFGERTRKGAANPNFMKNQSVFAHLLKSARHPVTLILFDKDQYDPGGRNGIAAAQLKDNGVPHLFINSPKGFEGSYGGSLPVFDYLHGACIERFLTSPKATDCTSEYATPLVNACLERFLSMPEAADCIFVNPQTEETCRKHWLSFVGKACAQQEFAKLDFRMIVHVAQVVGRKESAVPDSAQFNDKTFLLYGINGGMRTVTFRPDAVAEIHTPEENSLELWSLTGNQLCFGLECQIVMSWDKGNYHGFDDGGLISSWWIEK